MGLRITMDTSTFSVSLLLLAAMGSVSVGEFPTEQMIKEWADQMQKDLISLTDAASGMDSLIQSYHNHRDRFKVESNNPTHLVAKAAENIEKLLLTRSQALKVSLGWLESSAVLHRHHRGREDDDTLGKKARRCSRTPMDGEKIMTVLSGSQHALAQVHVETVYAASAPDSGYGSRFHTAGSVTLMGGRGFKTTMAIVRGSSDC
ncbi:unnamed protein product [Arctogadus glacialis]